MKVAPKLVTRVLKSKSPAGMDVIPELLKNVLLKEVAAVLLSKSPLGIVASAVQLINVVSN